ncbi:hypothetical protein [Streptomyces sp. NPDC058412]|uniref:hypothetical protein n=1 Tax=Streptomyces sp. NPDC058412 TaxID=3346486 RepID=UPI0036555439
MLPDTGTPDDAQWTTVYLIIPAVACCAAVYGTEHTMTGLDHIRLLRADGIYTSRTSDSVH